MSFLEIATQSRRSSLLLILGVAFVMAIAFQGTRGVYESTEGRYAECAQEMMQTGTLSEPILNGQKHWTKPPLAYLAIIASIHIFGDSPWGLRAYLVFAMVVTVAAVWWTGVLIWGAQAGFLAGLVCATSPFLISTANIISTDMLVTLWAALAIAAFWHARTHHSNAAAMMMWVFLGLGCLTKGPPALLVPVIAISSAVWFLKKQHAWQPGVRGTILGVAVFLSVGFGWFIWKACEYPELSNYWIGREMIGRNLSDEFKRNPGVAYIFTNYLPIVLCGTGPWLAMVLLLKWRHRHIMVASPRVSTLEGATQWSLLLGVVLSFIIFSLSHSKLPLYLAPLFIPLCLLIGREFDRMIQHKILSPRTLMYITLSLMMIILVGKAAAGIPERVRDMTRLSSRLSPILTREQPEGIYLVNKRPLNGLEYHLHRKISFIEPEILGNHMLNQGQTNILYIAKKRDWLRVAPQISVGVNVEEIGPYWVGISPRH